MLAAQLVIDESSAMASAQRDPAEAEKPSPSGPRSSSSSSAPLA